MFNGTKTHKPRQWLSPNSQWIISDYLRRTQGRDENKQLMVFICIERTLCGWLAFELLIIVAYTISINILSIRMPTLLWSNKIDRDYLTCARKTKCHMIWWAKTEMRTIRANIIPTTSRRKIECHSDEIMTDDWQLHIYTAIAMRKII